MKRFLLFAAALLVCVSCGGQRAKQTASGGGETSSADENPPATIYETPSTPTMITNPEEQADWAARHYWDNFHFADTLGVAGWTDYAEQAFVNYAYYLLPNIPRELGDESVKILFRKASANKPVFQKFAGIAEDYLFDPNSPYRNEDAYIAALNVILASPLLDQWEKIRPEEQLRLALKNRVGETASDFRYTLASGATGMLHGLRSQYTLLFFNNPGCPACREVMTQITGSPFLSRLVEEGALTVLAVYPDADLEAWRTYAPNIPADWINSYDAIQTIKKDEVYDLKAIPTLYLLDSSKKVVLKDVMSVPLIEQTIYNRQQK